MFSKNISCPRLKYSCPYHNTILTTYKKAGNKACTKKEMICLENIINLLTKDIDKCMEIGLEDNLHIINSDESKNGARTSKHYRIKVEKT